MHGEDHGITEAREDIIAWRFDVARNAMSGQTYTAYVNRSDNEQAWRIVRSRLPSADLMSEAGMSAMAMAWDNQSPFESGEDIRFA
ncbi:hypothetical protein [Lichenifustis flavocetrariae]|uniref:Uncharacterized protein n=1 Tax=Lichenifustis flavocetrariae TaxID=2949735 RepID=A0AA41Z3K8_9HYPH|nr:hypothetical protein [Lichenifustis flavocetrariae]MCW6512386.1 hypothetical protein [Lichenifustis flavocetrariae]